MKIVNIIVYYRRTSVSGTIVNQRFSDWFDFADFLKQEELDNKEITIVKWVYDVKHI